MKYLLSVVLHCMVIAVGRCHPFRRTAQLKYTFELDTRRELFVVLYSCFSPVTVDAM